jgi:Skp family chaperone for outer membrane proteins
MSRSGVQLWWLLALITFLVASPALIAQKPTQFAVVDIQAALLGTRDGRQATEALQAKVLPRRTEFENRQHDIDAENQRLKDDTSLPDDKRDELTQALERKRKKLEREERDAEEELQQEEGQLINKYSPLLVKILEKYASEHQYAMIFDISDPHNPVLWASETVDLTKTIIALYDEAALQTPSSTPAAPPKASNAAKPAPTAKPN